MGIILHKFKIYSADNKFRLQTTNYKQKICNLEVQGLQKPDLTKVKLHSQK